MKIEPVRCRRGSKIVGVQSSGGNSPQKGGGGGSDLRAVFRQPCENDFPSSSRRESAIRFCRSTRPKFPENEHGLNHREKSARVGLLDSSRDRWLLNIRFLS